MPCYNPTLTSKRLVETMARLSMDDSTMAEYMGVSPHTLRKWLTGERCPGAATLRLLDVLGVIEAICPAVHASLMPKSSGENDMSVNP